LLFSSLTQASVISQPSSTLSTSTHSKYRKKQKNNSFVVIIIIRSKGSRFVSLLLLCVGVTFFGFAFMKSYFFQSFFGGGILLGFCVEEIIILCDYFFRRIPIIPKNRYIECRIVVIVLVRIYV
jgi:hypothetical protein